MAIPATKKRKIKGIFMIVDKYRLYKGAWLCAGLR